MAQSHDAFDLVQSGRSNHTHRFRLTRNNSINPSAVLPFPNVHVLQHFFRYVIGMLDDGSLHVQQVDRAVGSMFETDGSKIRIATGNKLTGLLFFGAAGSENRSVHIELIPVHDITDDITYEDAIVQRRKE